MSVFLCSRFVMKHGLFCLSSRSCRFEGFFSFVVVNFVSALVSLE